jgi:predicted site-specific integrase-resolvase
MPDLVPLQDAAEEFGVGVTTLYRYLASGELRRYKRSMDRRTFVDRAQLRKLREPRQVRTR